MDLRNVGRAFGQTIKRLTTLDDWFLSGREMPFNSGGVMSSGTDAAYMASAVCYSCIRRKAQDISGVPLLFLRNPDDPESVVPDTDPIVQLFNRPNPTLSREQFLQYMITFLEMRGEFFVVFDDPAHPRVAYPWTDPLGWQDKTDEQGNLTAWVYKYGRGQQATAFDTDLLRHRYIDPARPYRGQSPIKSAADPFAIETRGDALQSGLISNGGENGNIFLADSSMGDRQVEQVLQQVRTRRQGQGRPLRDVLLTGGVKPADPKFTDTDLDLIAMQEPSRQKLCAVYVMTAALIYHDDAPNFATFNARLKIYWTSTVIPLVRGIESAFDRFFVEGPPRSKVYVRFDLDKVEALQANLGEKLEAAKSLHDMRVPLATINERLKLNLTLDNVPWAEDVMVPSTLAPLSVIMSEYVYADKAKVRAGGSDSQKVDPPPVGLLESARALVALTNDDGRPKTRAEVIDRATNPHFTVARERRMEKMRRELAKSWRLFMGKQKERFVKAATDSAINAGEVDEALTDLFPALSKGAVGVMSPFYTRSANEGAAAITEILEANPPRDLIDIINRSPNLAAATLDAIEERENFIKLDMMPGFFEDLQADVMAVMVEDIGGLDPDTVRRTIKHKFNVSINRSATIARTEIGTAYNVSRFTESGRAGYEKHEWLTSGDEMVRGSDDDFDHAQCHEEPREMGKKFSCGLKYPMEQGGEAGNVINCRCMTIPIP